MKMNGENLGKTVYHKNVENVKTTYSIKTI